MVSAKPEVDTTGSSLRKRLKAGEWCMRRGEEGKAASSWHGTCVLEGSPGLCPKVLSFEIYSHSFLVH